MTGNGIRFGAGVTKIQKDSDHGNVNQMNLIYKCIYRWKTIGFLICSAILSIFGRDTSKESWKRNKLRLSAEKLQLWITRLLFNRVIRLCKIYLSAYFFKISGFYLCFVPIQFIQYFFTPLSVGDWIWNKACDFVRLNIKTFCSLLWLQTSTGVPVPKIVYNLIRSQVYKTIMHWRRMIKNANIFQYFYSKIYCLDHFFPLRNITR